MSAMLQAIKNKKAQSAPAPDEQMEQGEASEKDDKSLEAIIAGLSDEEKQARKELIHLCKDIVEEFMED